MKIIAYTSLGLLFFAGSLILLVELIKMLITTKKLKSAAQLLSAPTSFS